MEEERQKKMFIMKVGIGFFMLLILVFWIISLRNSWRQPTVNIVSQATSSQAEWSQVKENLTKTISEFSLRLEKFESDRKVAQEIASSSLIQSLIEETNKIASSSASSTVATSTPKNNNCPAYINCMPTIGEPRPCQIPAGCEGITQIAY